MRFTYIYVFEDMEKVNGNEGERCYYLSLSPSLENPCARGGFRSRNLGIETSRLESKKKKKKVRGLYSTRGVDSRRVYSRLREKRNAVSQSDVEDSISNLAHNLGPYIYIYISDGSKSHSE